MNWKNWQKLAKKYNKNCSWDFFVGGAKSFMIYKSDIILDCFAGSGTTGVAAVELGRDYLLCEKNTVYFEKAQKRIEEADRQKILL